MNEPQQSFPWKQALRFGLIGGAIALLLSLIGMVEAFSRRDIIFKILTMGHILFLLPILLYAYSAIRRSGELSSGRILALSLLAGATGGFVLTLLILVGQAINLRAMFVNASPALFNILVFGTTLPLGAAVPLLVGLLLGLIATGVYLLPMRMRTAFTQAVVWVVALGLLRDLITTVISRWGPLRFLIEWLFAYSGLSLIGAIVVFILAFGISFWRFGRKPAAKIQRSPAQQRTIRIASMMGFGLLLLVLPFILGIFFSEILDNVGLYILMGLGLNIVVGFAGLLDLGYVAFYAIGAYTMGVLTSTGLNFFNWTFWQALPFAIIIAVFSGILLGLPVLRMRGDYLAIVTLGFGEIVRLLVLSDWLRPYLGGTQGIQSIAQPRIGPILLDTQQDLYYLIIAGIAFAAFVAWRLKDSRLGRSWMALREDEDVAQTMGINLVLTKLSAFAVGALFSGLSGAIFAAKLTSAYAHSFNFMVSINVLCLIIVGGMGSIPGVIVGALALVGLPELLREFAEFRLLVYGAVLVVMMLQKPEGLWPEERRKLELHEREAEIEEVASEAVSAAD